MVDFGTREGIMKEWDSWVRYYRSGGSGTWPRDAFESLLDYFEEQRNQTSQSSGRKYPCGCYGKDDIVIDGKNQCNCGLRR